MTFLEKIIILKKSKRIFKNWIIFPLTYFGILNKEFIIFKTKSNKFLKIRKNSTDLMTLINVWLLQEYNHPSFTINSEDVVIDIGAHIGLFTVYASQFCNRGKIISFEPIKENYDLLLENIKINNLKNVTTFNLAISKNTEMLTLYINDDQAGHSKFSKTSQSVIVKSISLKKIFDENCIDYCNFLKIDCEGSEYEIINELPSDYLSKIDKMIIEYHMADSHPELLLELETKLRNYFQLDIRPSLNGMGIIYAQKINKL